MNYRGQPDTLQSSLPAGDGIRMDKALRALQYFFVVAIGIGSAQGISAQEEKETKKQYEIRYKMKLSTTPPAEQTCAAQIYFTYLQKNTVAVVDSTIDNTECEASSGDYTVLVRFRDENNEIQSLEYSESWSRDDDKAVESRKEYFIGDNVDLVNVRAKKLRCICDTAGAEAEAPE